jgi:multidrug resistance efflux pump
MRNALVQDLADCTEFRQTLQARPPRLVHGTLLLLAALLGTALVWSALTRANLVVRAPGRVRPVTSPMKVVNGGSGEVFSASAGARVVEVQVREGQEVRQGEVLLRLDTARLDNELTKQRRAIQVGEGELAQLAHMEELVGRQYAAAKAKAEVELAQGREEVAQARQRQAAEVRLGELELQSAEYEEVQKRRLVERGLAARDELRRAMTRVHEAREKGRRARLPVDERKVEMLRQGLVLLEKDYAMKRQDLEMKRGLKQGEVAAARLALANLELEHRQAVIRAPLDGIVTAGEVKVGDLLERGKPVMEIAAQQGFCFEAAVPSTEVGHLRLGMPARIKLDAYDYQQYGTVAGTVVFISPDSGVLEGHSTVTYLVRVALAGEEVGRGDLHGRVKLGMAGQAEIVTGQESLLTLLVKKLRQTMSVG